MVSPAGAGQPGPAAPGGGGAAHRSGGGGRDAAPGEPDAGGSSGAGGATPDAGDGCRPVVPPPDVGAGEAIVRFDVVATVAFVVVSALAAALPDPLEYVAVPLDLVLFLVGCGAFLWAYAVAVGRSRYESLTMAGVFFPGAEVAPPRVVRRLRLALGVQIVAAVVVAAVRPFTALAFGILVPMLGLGLMALWGARHGRFPPRSDDDGPPGR